MNDHERDPDSSGKYIGPYKQKHAPVNLLTRNGDPEPSDDSNESTDGYKSDSEDD